MRVDRGSSSNIEEWRIRFIYFLVVGVFGFYVLRLFSLQILENDLFMGQAEEKRITNISVQTERGIIFDRNGVVLARNIASYNVVITPAQLPGFPTDIPLPGAVEEIYRKLSPLINIPVKNGILNDETVRTFTPCQTEFGISEIVIIGDTNAPYDPVRIACDVDQETAVIIREMSADWPGVDIEI